jgi:SAM-dependent methyltransferase
MTDNPITDNADSVREQVRERYARAALTITDVSSDVGRTSAADCCGEGGCGADFGAALYVSGETTGLPDEAVLASLGCGNPTAVADLREGETVLDLGSGGGIDVLLSAKRVGASGFAYGLDMTDEMLDLARAIAAKAGATNVEFLKGEIEKIPLEDASVDVIISNCVINLSTDKSAVLRESFRVLKPGGRLGVSDVVAENQLSPGERAQRGSYVGCIAGALSKTQYEERLAEAGFEEATVEFTYEAADGMHGAIVKAVKPASAAGPRTLPLVTARAGSACC